MQTQNAVALHRFYIELAQSYPRYVNKEGEMKLFWGKKAFVFLMILAVMILFTAQAPAEIYRWVDENGVTHFSDQPPPSSYNKKVETVDPSKSGSLTVMEGGGQIPTPSVYLKELFSREEKEGLNKNASVVIYTTAT